MNVLEWVARLFGRSHPSQNDPEWQVHLTEVGGNGHMSIRVTAPDETTAKRRAIQQTAGDWAVIYASRRP